MAETNLRRVMMTPEWAARLIANNRGNRKFRPSQVNYLAEEIRLGHWQFNRTNAIGVRDDGRLGNGEHRLRAIVQAGIAVPVMFAEGMTDAEFMITDTGIKRSIADALGISVRLAADCGLIHALLNPTMSQKRASVDVVTEVALWWGPTHQRLMDISQANPKGLTSAAIRVGVGLHIAQQTDAALNEYITQQWKALMTLDIGRLSRPVGVLYNRFNKTSGHAVWNERLVAVALTWRCFDPDPRLRDTRPKLQSQDSLLGEVRQALIALRDRSYDIEPQPVVELAPPIKGGKGSRPKKADRVPAQVAAHV